VRVFGPPSIKKLEEARDVAGLIEALQSEKTGRRLDAIQAMGRLSDPQAGSALVDALTDASVRDAAAASLLVMAPQVMDVLVLTLRQANPLAEVASADPAVRAQVAAILGFAGDERAVEPLAGALDDVDEVGQAAVRALSSLGNPGGVEPLCAALTRYGVPAVDALGELGDARATGAIVEWVMPQSQVRRDPNDAAAAIRALGKIGPSAVVLPFIRRVANSFPGPDTPNGDIIQAAVTDAEASLGVAVERGESGGD
jgi:HEAT repeat protein